MKIVDLFSGAGGFVLGAQQAGATLVACVELNADAAATSRAAGHPVVQADVGAVAEWASGLRPIDLVIGGPPCQPFSKAGAELGLEDHRDGFPAALDAIAYLKPTWVALENVRGFLSPKHRAYRTALRLRLRELYPWVGLWTLNAADFGVPQCRRRVFIVCGPRPVRAPVATHGDPSLSLDMEAGLFGTPARRLLPWVSAGEVIGTALMVTGRYGEGRPPKAVEGPAPSLMASYGRDKQPWNRAGHPWIVGEGDRRRLTVSEYATLQSFPADYPWQGNQESQYRQVGNAVPPPLGAAVVAAILGAERTLTESRPNRPSPRPRPDLRSREGPSSPQQPDLTRSR